MPHQLPYRFSGLERCLSLSLFHLDTGIANLYRVGGEVVEISFKSGHFGQLRSGELSQYSEIVSA